MQSGMEAARAASATKEASCSSFLSPGRSLLLPGLSLFFSLLGQCLALRGRLAQSPSCDGCVSVRRGSDRLWEGACAFSHPPMAVLTWGAVVPAAGCSQRIPGIVLLCPHPRSRPARLTRRRIRTNLGLGSPTRVAALLRRAGMATATCGVLPPPHSCRLRYSGQHPPCYPESCALQGQEGDYLLMSLRQ